MRTRIPLTAFALCTVVALAISTGCTSPDSPPATPGASPPDERALAISEAEQAVRDYYRVRDQCMADPPNTDPSCFEGVSEDNALTRDQLALENAQTYGFHYVGTIVFERTLKVLDVQLPQGLPKEITLLICTDATAFQALRADGSPMDSANSSEHLRLLYVVQKRTDTWKVADIRKDPGEEAC